MSPSKLTAGGLAAATSAVFGSYFGALGTVAGAALASIATALSAELYHRVIERTRDQLSSRGRGRCTEYSRGRTTRGRAVPRLLIGSAVIFALGIGVVSGIEWATGGPLSGGSHGTTLGRVLGTDLTTSDEVTGSDRQGGAVGGLLSELTGAEDDSGSSQTNN